jgi:hypothetical protein
MAKYTCAFQWLKDNEDVVDVVKEANEYKVSCRGIYIGTVGFFGGAHIDQGFFSACSVPREEIGPFLERAAGEYTRTKHRNKGREVLLKINELENTEDRE